jgi:hypothetical protein
MKSQIALANRSKFRSKRRLPASGPVRGSPVEGKDPAVIVVTFEILATAAILECGDLSPLLPPGDPSRSADESAHFTLLHACFPADRRHKFHHRDQPVIAKVFIHGIIPHWVLIVGKERNEYLMCDPLGDGQTVRRLSDYESKVHAIRTLKRSG